MSLFFQRYFFSFSLLFFSFRASPVGICARPSISIINGGFDILPLPGAVKSIEESRGPTYWNEIRYPRNRNRNRERRSCIKLSRVRISIEAGTIDSENRKVIEENRSRQCRENFFSPRKKPLFLFLPFSFLLLIDAIPRFIDISRVAGIIEQALSKRGNTILGENTPNSSRAERVPLRCSDLFRARYNRKVGKSKGLYRNTISLSNSGNLEPRLRQAKIDSLREIGYATTGRLYNNNEQHACTRFSRG